MAEQRPYRAPGFSANEQLTRTKAIALLSLAAAFISINAVTTQHVASALRDASWLGAPIAQINGTALYAPWSWIVWWSRWYWAPELSPLWRECAQESLYPMAIVTAFSCIAIALVRQGWLGEISDLHGSARWAILKDLIAAGLIDARSRTRRAFHAAGLRLRILRALPRRAGVYLGIWREKADHRYIRDCGPAHVLVFAPTRSGKGVGVVIPTLLTWPHSVLVHDIKGENWALTAGARKRMGQTCLRFAPASSEEGSARYNPLAEVRLRTLNELRDVRNIVQMILDPDGRGLPDHWAREGSAFLAGMILDQLYLCKDKTLSGLESRLCDPAQPIDDTIQQIMRAEHDSSGAMGWRDSQGNPTRTHPNIARAMRSMLDKSDNERSGVISEVKGFLELYRDPVIAQNTAVSDFHIADLMNHERPVSLYIVVPLAHKNSLKPVIRLMLGQIVHRLTETLEFRDGRALPAFKHRLLLMIDEFPTLGRLDVFAESLSLIPGYGIKACLVAQDLSQIHAAYGHDESITSSCQTKVAFTPNRIETARLLSQMTGETTVRHTHRSVSNSGASVSEPEVARPLLTPDEVMRLGANEALIFTTGYPVIRARKIRHYADQFFAGLAKIKMPLVSDRIAHDAHNPDGEPDSGPPPAASSSQVNAPDRDPNTSPNSAVVAEKPPGGQLSFLKVHDDSKSEPPGKPKKDGRKERLL